MEIKDEALKFANQLDGLNSCEPVIIKACETMIRRLVEELDKQEKSDANLHLTPLSDADQSLLNSNKSISQHKAIMRKNAFNEYIPLFLGNDGLPEGTLLYATLQTKPLSEDEIINLWHKAQGVKHGN